ncbi:MAG: heme o synthase [Pseudomonadota bacterium]
MPNSLTIDTHQTAATSMTTCWDYFALFKPRVMALVIFTAWVGATLAPGTLHPFLYFVSILCIATGAGASGALNMWYDRDIDLLMTRTKARPLPSGRVTPEDALTLGIILSVGSVITLGFAANYLAACWLAFTIWFYVVVYTMVLKRSTSQNIVIGGAAGAFPPLIGWLALSPHINVSPFTLFLIIFLWTPPHFWALALCQQGDYERASLPMLPNVRGRRATILQILIYSVLMVIASFLPYMINLLGIIYLMFAGVLGCFFMFFATKLWRHQATTNAMRLFKFSIFYLFALFLGILIDHWIG